MTAEIVLSVLVPSVTSRWDTFARNIQEQLYSQLATLPAQDQHRVEILVLTDNKQRTIGAKRNQMLALAQGRYVAFVDDDDRLEPNYLTSLLEAAQSGADVLCFDVLVSLDGGPVSPCFYSIKFGQDRNQSGHYERLPNHLMAVKREYALRSPFPELNKGEDSAYAKRLRPFLETEHQIGRVLYHYDYSSETTETQQSTQPVLPVAPAPSVLPVGEPVMDVVILSRAVTAYLRQMTQAAIDSCIAYAGAPVHMIVMEQIDGIHYRNAVTLRAPAEFAYNAFANHAATFGTAPWIMVANNDLVFEEGWLAPLLDAGNPVVSPMCPNEKRQRGLTVNLRGTQIGTHFAGWCFAITRDLWEKIDGFDEDFAFWCADDAVVQQVLALGVEPMVVPASRVVHLGSITHRQQADPNGERTWAQVWKFEQKYGVTKFPNSREYLRWKYRFKPRQARVNRRVRL